jgi:hypothetical protein
MPVAIYERSGSERIFGRRLEVPRAQPMATKKSHAKAGKLNRSDLVEDARYPYLVGHDKDAPQVHRYVIKAS